MAKGSVQDESHYPWVGMRVSPPRPWAPWLHLSHVDSDNRMEVGDVFCGSWGAGKETRTTVRVFSSPGKRGT